MKQLFFAEEPDSCRWNFGASLDSLRAVIDPYDFDKWYPLDSLFISQAGDVFFQPGRTGSYLVIDTAFQQAYWIKDFQVKLVAGVRGTSGYRTGPGRQAILGIGGLQDAYGVAVLSNGDFVFPSARAGKMSRLSHQLDDSWSLSEIAQAGNANSVTVDAFDNIWWADPYSAFMSKLSLNGVISTYPTPTTNVAQILAVGKYLFMITRFNSWDIIMRYDTVTQESVRIAGMTTEEIDAWKLIHGIQLVDGDAINGATFHSVGIGYISPDGSEIFVGNGDERQVRRIKDGQVTSLIIDGTWQSTQCRLGYEDNGGPRPFYVVGPAGKQPNGYPWFAPLWFEPHGGRTAILKIDITDVPDIPPSNGGGGIPVGYQAEPVDIAYPNPMVALTSNIVKVSMRNSGSIPWTKLNMIRLGADQPHDDATKFGISRVELSDTDIINPGDIKEFVFTVTAPAVGVVPSEVQTYKMVHDANDTTGAAGWFGNIVTMAVQLTNSTIPPVNLPPLVNAGPDRVITLPNDVLLTGVVTDPEGQPTSSIWSKLSGPGVVTFVSFNTPQTHASFSEAGVYVVRLTSSDGVNTSLDDIQITVNSKPQGVPMNSIVSWTTKVQQNVPNAASFTKWRVTVQIPGIVPVITGSAQISVTIPLPVGVAPGSYNVLVERVSSDLSVVLASAIGVMIVPASTNGSVTTPDVVTIVLQ